MKVLIQLNSIDLNRWNERNQVCGFVFFFAFDLLKSKVVLIFFFIIPFD